MFCRINPVLGCYEPPKPNPFECMSAEQQEHEVMQLVSKMDKLTRYLKIIHLYNFYDSKLFNLGKD